MGWPRGCPNVFLHCGGVCFCLFCMEGGVGVFVYIFFVGACVGMVKNSSSGMVSSVGV